MIRYINFAFSLVLLLTSCGEPEEPRHIKEMAAKQDSLANALDEKKTIHQLQYNCPVDTKLTPYHGTIKASAGWEDKKGKNILIITERPQYFWKDENPSLKKFTEDPDEDSEAAELFAWHYIYNENEKKWEALWKLNDFTLGCCDVEMEYLPWTLRISDLDSNGIAESIFTYNTSGGTGPIDNFWYGKLILHVDTVKCSIKGNLGKVEAGEENKLIWSESFAQLDPLFKNYSNGMWKRSHEIRDSLYREKYIKPMMQF